MTEEGDTEDTDDSRRSFMKKGALASSAVALGLAGSGTVAGEIEQQSAQQTQPQSGLQALVFVDDYNPAVQLQIVSRIQQPTVNQILGYVNPAQQQGGQQNQTQGQQGQQGSAVVDPTDWNGYIFNYIGCGPGNYNLLFVREGSLQQGQTYSFTTNAVYFSNQLQLLETELQSGGGGQGGGATGGGNVTNPS